MAKQYIAHDYQGIMTEFILDHERGAIWAGMGLGKTVGTLTAIDILMLAGYVRVTLVLAPLRVAQSTWVDEVEKWAHTNHLRISAIVGDVKTRRRALNKPADIYTMNYENIPWLIEELQKQNRPWFFDMIVSDESTKLKGFRLRQGGKRARELARVAHKHCDRFLELTGTPSPNGLKDLWGQLWFVDAGRRLGRTWTAFTQRWFQKSFDGWGLEPLPFAQEQIESQLKDVCLSLNAADYFDLEQPIENVIEVELPAEARKHYNEMEKLMFTEVADHEIEALSAAAKTMKCLQLANGAAYVGEVGSQKWEEIHDGKIEALKSIVEEACGMPVLVAYHFKSDLARLQRAFKNGRALDKNPQTLRDWNKGKIPIMFAHPASAGHGLNLQDGGNILAFFSLNWNLEEHQQIIERIGPTRQKQAGYDRPVFIHYITAKNTVDQMIKLRLETKREVQDILMEAMKHR